MPSSFFPDSFFHNPEGFVKALEKFLKVFGKQDDRLTLKTAFIPVLAFHDVEVEIPQPIFLDIEKVGPVLEQHPG
jgi:hypothetical protein